MGKLKQVTDRIQRLYEGDANRPLRGYAVAIGTYGSLAAGLTALGRALGVSPPERLDAGDTVLLAVATHKASRMLAKDTIASPLRAPFTKYEESAGEAELNESVRGHGAQHAVGELISCPFCLAVWVGTGLAAGMVFVPRGTRLVCTILTAVAGSDFLQLAYDGSKQKVAVAAKQAK
jgi:hypothetical protein